MDSQIANRHPIDALMHSKQPEQGKKDDSTDCHSSIRTLQFVHRGPFIYNEIREYFQTFGEIKFMQINSGDRFHYGYVRIEMVNMVAKAVLSKISHRIANCMVNVAEVNIPDDRILAPLNPLSVPTDQDATNHILILNDDCLRNVLERLNLSDLGKAADVCVRFNQQAKEIFRLKYKDFTGKTVGVRSLKMSDIEIIIRNFGSLIQSLEINKDLLKFWEHNEERDIVYWIAKYCCNIKKLTICYPDKLFKILQPLFARLDHFKMEKLSYSRDDQGMDETMEYLLSVCDNLKTIHLNSYMEISHSDKLTCLERKFPSLQEASIFNFAKVTDETLKTFITLNPTLNKLTIKSGNKSRSTETTRSIGQHLINLTELEFDDRLDTDEVIEEVIESHQNDIQCLGSLGSLKVLKLNFAWLCVTPLMESLAANEIPIEHLDLRHGEVKTAAIKAISKLKQIKILKFFKTKRLADYDLIELAKELPQLSELHLEYDSSRELELNAIAITEVISHASRLSHFKLDLANEIKIDLDDYKAMLESVQNRPKLTKLVIGIRSNVVEVNVPEAVLHQNRDFLDIKWCMVDNESENSDTETEEDDFSYPSDTDSDDY